MQPNTPSEAAGPSSAEASLTVAELAAAPDLHLEVVAGHAGVTRVIEAVYIGDLDDPTPWMVQGSLVLTTGPRLEENPDSGAELVRLLKRSGMVGVGVAIRPNVSAIPEVMLAAGDHEGLPVLRVPEETPFRRVTSYVFNALASRDMHRLRRSVAMQQHLVEALLDEHSVAALVRRLAELLDADVAVLDRRGGILARWSAQHWSADDDAFVARAWLEYGRLVEHGAPRSVFELDDRYVAFREVRGAGRVQQLLLVAHPAGRLISELADASLSFAQRLLEVELTSTRGSGDVRRRTRSGLLELLLHQRGNPVELAERLLYHGIEPNAPWRIAVLAVTPAGDRAPSPEVVEMILASVDEALEQRGLSFLSHRLAGEVLVLCQSPELSGDGTSAVRALFEELTATLRRQMNLSMTAAGVSGALTGVESVSRAIGQARLALRHGASRGEPFPTTLFEDLGVQYVVLDSLSEAALRDLKRAVVDRLRAADDRRGTELVETLRAYVATDCSVVETAKALFLHRNTLRKRLSRIEQVLGIDLSSTGGRVEVYLGVRAADVLETRQTEGGQDLPAPVPGGH
jgi:PucR family transcriptional regulator, purine catabolism regulatory protein